VQGGLVLGGRAVVAHGILQAVLGGMVPGASSDIIGWSPFSVVIMGGTYPIGTTHNLKCETLQLDEIWCYVGKKQRHVKITDNLYEVGDQWVFVALDADSKLIPSFLVGKRSYQNAVAFVDDLSRRLDNRVQLSTDSLKAYPDAIELAFGSEVDYGQ
jgi:IS1 family transposase